MHRVMVGVIGHNDPDLLGDCLSAINATVLFGQFRLYVDDCSLESNVGVAAAMDWPTVRLKQWSGAAAARNVLFKLGREQGFKFVAAVDQDMIMQDGWLSSLLAVMDAEPWCGIAAFRCAYSGTVVHRTLFEHYDRVPEVASQCSLYRLRALHEAQGHMACFGMDPRLRCILHDTELCQRLKQWSGWRTYVTPVQPFRHDHASHSTRGINAERVNAQREQDKLLWGDIINESNWWDVRDVVTDPPADPPPPEE